MGVLKVIKTRSVGHTQIHNIILDYVDFIVKNLNSREYPYFNIVNKLKQNKMKAGVEMYLRLEEMANELKLK